MVMIAAKTATRADPNKAPTGVDGIQWYIKKSKDHEVELQGVMKQINDLLKAERRQNVNYKREYKHEDPRALHYAKILRSIGFPERHARFAPWFYKSDQVKLNRFSSVLFQKIKDDYDESLKGTTEGERALLSYKKCIKALEDKNLEPWQWNQVMIKKAFRNCSFHVVPFDFENLEKEKRLHPAFQARDVTRDIALVQYSLPAPGLAPPVLGRKESHEKHKYVAYSGLWKKGHMRGPNGVYKYADGGQYIGTWQDSVQCGAGTADYPNGASYRGSWKNGKYEGEGTMEYANGTTYEGTWKKGYREGKGKLTYPSGATYEGEFFLGVKYGKGTATSSAGFKYTGQWQQNRIHGIGILTLLNGHKVKRDNWGPCILGEAVRDALAEHEKEKWNEFVELTRLLRVRDDIRVVQLHRAYRTRKARDDAEEEAQRKTRLKALRKDKKEAQEAARGAFLEEMLKGEEESSSDDSGSAGSEESGDSFEEGEESDEESEVSEED